MADHRRRRWRLRALSPRGPRGRRQSSAPPPTLEAPWRRAGNRSSRSRGRRRRPGPARASPRLLRQVLPGRLSPPGTPRARASPSPRRMGRREARGPREVPRRGGGRAPRTVGRRAGGGDESDARQVVARGDRAVVPGDARGGADGDAAAGIGRRAVEKSVKARAFRGVAPRENPALDRRGGWRGHAGVYRRAAFAAQALWAAGAAEEAVAMIEQLCAQLRTVALAAHPMPSAALAVGETVARACTSDWCRRDKAGDDGALSLVPGAEGEQAAALCRGSGRQAAQGGAAGVHLTKCGSFSTSLSIV